MFKFSVLVLLIWQGICEVSCRDEDQISTTQQLTLSMNQIPFEQSRNDDEKKLNVLGQHYDIYAENITINLSGRSSYQTDMSVFGNTDQEHNFTYTETSGIGAHKLYRSALPWKKARRICTMEQSHLAVIRSDFEEKVILQMMREMAVEDAWLGIHDQFKEGEWLTIMDEPLRESGWEKWSKTFWINPDNFQDNQNCARLLRDGGGMDDENCDVPKPFVCKITNV